MCLISIIGGYDFIEMSETWLERKLPTWHSTVAGCLK